MTAAEQLAILTALSRDDMLAAIADVRRRTAELGGWEAEADASYHELGIDTGEM